MRETRTLELLSPASDKETGKQAILHGADAVYIGGPSHGARKSAANSLDDITELVEFAHSFRAKVYVTVNTIVYENEIRTVEILCRDLYYAGVDALIIQDMGILRMKIPPIALHASTQCHITTPEKALFLQEAGFSQIVLERGLTLKEIKNITTAVNIPVECFIHGALCVSNSGRCHASHKLMGRSANRGECSQICRLPFDLMDSKGRILLKNKYPLSLKDLNLSHRLEDLVEAGVDSFKIEGRLKEVDYVKNITAFYNNQLNSIIKNSFNQSSSEDIINCVQKLRRSSYGRCEVNFEPQPEKSFNRGFTSFLLSEGKNIRLASLDTPKSKGEVISDPSVLKAGDGISFFDKNGKYDGVLINGNNYGKLMFSRKVEIPQNTKLYRTFEREWKKQLNRPTGKRKISVRFILDSKGVTAIDEMNNLIRLPLNFEVEKTEKDISYESEFSKLGTTHFEMIGFENRLPSNSFIPLSIISGLRRNLCQLLISDNKINYPFEYRRKEKAGITYLFKEVDFRENVANSLAEKFYNDYGVKVKEKALEVQKGKSGKEERILMTTRHCILRELGMCKKISPQKQICEPLYLVSGNLKLKLRFDCKECEMRVIG